MNRMNSVSTTPTANKPAASRKGRLRVTLPTDIAIGAKARAKTLGISVSEYFLGLSRNERAATMRFMAMQMTESVVMNGDRVTCTLTPAASKLVKAAAYADNKGDVRAWVEEWMHANLECDCSEIVDRGMSAAVVAAAA